MLQAAILFKDHMIIQRDKPISVWGTAQSGSMVCVSMQHLTVETQADADGKWMLRIGPFHVSFSETMRISSDAEEVIFQDVAVGEVWLAGGQSNMEFHMRHDADMAAERPVCKNAHIRFFDYPEVFYAEQIHEADYERNYGFWRICTPEQLERFSAVGYYFAKDIHQELNVPVGVIGCNWSGTPACAWMSEDAVVRGGGQVYLDEYREAIKDLDLLQYDEQFQTNPANWKVDLLADPINDLTMFGCTQEEMAAKLTEMGIDLSSIAGSEPVVGPKYEKRPCGLYESMLQSVAPYSIRGVIWYQGETDGDTHPEIYRTLFPSLIRCWRELWGEELPFLFVQIPPLAPLEQYMICMGDSYPIIRRAQQHTADTVKNTGMAVATDAGMQYDIHPKKKKPVGYRLALQALAKVYGKDVLCEAPTLSGCKTEDGKITLTFENAGTGLYLAECAPYGQQIGQNRLGGIQVIQEGIELTEKDFDARAEGSEVVLLNEKIRADATIKIRLAETAWHLVNLYNSEEIPARPAELP